MTATTSHPRGTVVLVNLEPITGSEQGSTRPDGTPGVRPCVVLSDAATIRASRARPLYVVAPLTRSTTLTGPLAPRLTARTGGVPRDSTVLLMHVRSIDPARVVGAGGTLNAGELEPIARGLRALFTLEDH